MVAQEGNMEVQVGTSTSPRKIVGNSPTDYRAAARPDTTRNRRELGRTQELQIRDSSRGARESRHRRDRAGGKGNADIRREIQVRRRAISKTLSMMCRHSHDVHRQINGFAALADISWRFEQRSRGEQIPSVEDIECIVRGEGDNTEMRSEWGS